MCGIAGIVKPATECIERSVIEEMTRAMTHRGPDGQGYFVHNHVALGHRRLSIIDIGGGDQPMFNEDGSIVVVYNGEIFNFLDVKATLEAKGHTFRTTCDTEVIVHAYEEYGEQCPVHFRGMFAFAVYDRVNECLLLARDRLGIKPLYYQLENNTLIFASEIKAIVSANPRKCEVDTGLIDFYMSVGYVPGDKTLFCGIRKLAPGHTLIWKHGAAQIDKYWDITSVPMLQISHEEAKEHFEHLLFESVRLRLMSDVPLGAFLSGGLDSSAIVALMSQMVNEPIKTFAIGYNDDPASSELEYARIVSQTCNTEHHEYILESGDFFDSLDVLLTHMEEPVVESCAVALYQLAQLAREHVTVILSGEGGDEILAGYSFYHKMPHIEWLHRIVHLAPSALRSAMSRLCKSEKSLKYWDWINSPKTERYWGISQDVTSSVKRRMYSREFEELSDDTARDFFRNQFCRLREGTDLRRMTYVDLKSWLPDDVLLKSDKMTMACSLELRVPLLDHKLVEFTTALPDHLRRKGAEGKVLLKQTMEKYLPRNIIYRRKQGFPVPIAMWFRGPLYQQICDILLDPRSLARGYFRPTYISNVLKRHVSGKEDLSRRIFSLITLELWHRKYID